MAAQALVRDIIQHASPAFPSLDKAYGDTKRHAIYIPQSFFDKARQAIAEAETTSSWEFSATISPSTQSLSDSSSSTASSPAREIVIRYRAGMPVQLDDGETRSELSIDDEEDGEGSTYYGPAESLGDVIPSPAENSQVTEIENAEIKLIYRQSCHQGLRKAREEAFQVMQTYGLGGTDLITCQRTGCSDTLRSAKDLTFHLHIHDLHDHLVSCSRCHCLYESQQDLNAHQCNGRRVRLFITPLKSILTRILSKLAYRK